MRNTMRDDLGRRTKHSKSPMLTDDLEHELSTVSLNG